MALRLAASVDLGPLGWAQVQDELGEGGQGYVYTVKRPTGEPLALKWYKRPFATAEQRSALARLVDLGAPSRQFLWPLALAVAPGEDGFGYVMRVRTRRYLPMAFLVANRDQNGDALDVSFAAVITLCRQLCQNFLKLHARGLCYRDISFGNVFFDPSSGEVLICDNDNVGYDDGTSTVYGTPYFMAPEIIGDSTSQTMPSRKTDLHSLAVMLFYALCIGHPFEGQKTEFGMSGPEWVVEHFGTEPVFVFDPDDNRNRCTAPHVEAYWRAYPTFLRNLFIRTFTEGIRDPSARAVETQWIRALARLRDCTLRCGACGQTNFWDEDEPGKQCLRCGLEIAAPLTLRLGKNKIVIGSATRLWSDRLVNTGDEPTMVGRVRPHPEDKERLGIQNLSEFTWKVMLPDGRTYPVQPGKIVEAMPGLRLELGGVSGAVLAPN